MDYENKYKQALSRATFYNNELLTENQRKMLLDIFPELTMSEDERMKDYIKDVIQAAIIPKKENKQKMIAWLEKQGEKDPCIGCTNDKGCVTKYEQIQVINSLANFYQLFFKHFKGNEK